MTICKSQHRYYPDFELLPEDQSHFNGRHKCAGCAYERGYDLGMNRESSITFNYSTLPDSQAGTVRHKSVQAAFAEGYRNGVLDSYR